MSEEILLLLNDLKEPILKILEDATKTSLFDYLPHVISALAVITSMIIVIIQHRQGIALQQKNRDIPNKKGSYIGSIILS